MNQFTDSGCRISNLDCNTSGESVWIIMENLKLSPSEEIKHFKFEAVEIAPLPSDDGSNNKPNRRFSLRPRKMVNYEDFETIVSPSPSRKNTHSFHKNLETIFEDPQVDKKNGSLNVLGKAKVKRFISFNEFVSKAKVKHRKSKIKRLGKGKGKKTVKRRLTLEDVKLKLKCLDSSDEESGGMDVQD